MLAGLVATDPGWLPRVLPFVDELLVEQAHLERKAASAALTYLFTYPDVGAIQQPLAELAREELSHFEIVLAHLRRRGLAMRRLRPGRYMAALKRAVRPCEPGRGLDSFLVSAVIEARSCERLKLLGDGLRGREPELARMYRGLAGSEARHHGVFVELARQVFAGADVGGRLAEIVAHEAGVLAAADPLPRLHG